MIVSRALASYLLLLMLLAVSADMHTPILDSDGHVPAVVAFVLSFCQWMMLAVVVPDDC